MSSHIVSGIVGMIFGVLGTVVFVEPAANVRDFLEDKVRSCGDAATIGFKEMEKGEANLSIVRRNLEAAAQCNTRIGGQAAAALSKLHCDGQFGKDEKFRGQMWLQAAAQNTRTLKSHYSPAQKSCDG
ncbi:hypothetical protein [Roseobacter sp.]|uniref:hypothetical protein n=1 Tax=Roseobacter sp. TaxID=1907202 RepID=UPI00329A4BF4